MNTPARNWRIRLDEASEDEYNALLRALRRKNGFGLYFVRCSPATGREIFQHIKRDLSIKNTELLQLEKSVDNLYTRIQNLPTLKTLKILFIEGIEKSLTDYIKPGYGGQGDYYKEDSVPRVLNNLNLQRERFQTSFKFLIVFLVPEFAFKYFTRRAPDFFDWRLGIFEFKEDNSFELIPQRTTLSGDSLLLLERYEEAISSYDQAIKYKPDKHEAWNNRGIALDKLGRYEEAISSYDQAIKYKPDLHEAWYNRGNALDELGRYEEAISSYDQAIKYKPDYHEAWYNMACCYALQGKVPQVIQSLNQAITMNPNRYLNLLKTDSDFDVVRQDERFQVFLREMFERYPEFA
ncbi:tetratricopeptide repeat protein [Candidatus Cyanaurora vandensis]|uniref:tetratricopeptide repeat protein n=1 Tax=Candidatus Cyanaurora vandensis TaxID=2714958 RepID=UPI00257D01C4|nr:tetratricopeptide repeat protein [Candidatus Cyanaurora vandensis]